RQRLQSGYVSRYSRHSGCQSGEADCHLTARELHDDRPEGEAFFFLLAQPTGFRLSCKKVRKAVTDGDSISRCAHTRLSGAGSPSSSGSSATSAPDLSSDRISSADL